MSHHSPENQTSEKTGPGPLVYLLFDAERIKPAPAWKFWAYSHASVYAWVNEPDVAAGKARAEADMQRRGWAVTRYEHAKMFEAKDIPPDIYAKACAKMARAIGRSYTFDRIEPPAKKRGAAASSRAETYDATDALRDPTVPAELRPLLHWADEWSIGDDVARSEKMDATTPEERRAFLDALRPHWDAIEVWCDAHRDATPVPDAVIILDSLLLAATEMQVSFGHEIQ